MCVYVCIHSCVSLYVSVHIHVYACAVHSSMSGAFFDCSPSNILRKKNLPLHQKLDNWPHWLASHSPPPRDPLSLRAQPPQTRLSYQYLESNLSSSWFHGKHFTISWMQCLRTLLFKNVCNHNVAFILSICMGEIHIWNTSLN